MGYTNITANQSHFSIGQLFSHFAKTRPLITCGLISAVIAYTILQLLVPQQIGEILEGIDGTAHINLALIAATLVTMQISVQCCKSFLTYVGTLIGLEIARRLYADIMHSMLHMDEQFHREHPAAVLVEQIDRDISSLATYCGEFCTKLAPQCLLLLGVGFYLLLTQPILGICMTCICALVLWLLRLLNKNATQLCHNANTIKLSIIAIVNQLFQQRHTTVFLNRNFNIIDQLQGLQKELVLQEGDAVTASTITWIVAIACTCTLIGTIMVMGYYLMLRQQITIGQVYVLINYAQLIQGPLEKLGELSKKYTRVIAAIERLQHLLQQRPISNHCYTKQPFATPEIVIIPGSVLENIVLFEPISEGQCKKKLEEIGLDKIFEYIGISLSHEWADMHHTMPSSIRTLIGIARSCVHNQPIEISDDSLAVLDSHARTLVIQACKLHHEHLLDAHNE